MALSTSELDELCSLPVATPIPQDKLMSAISSPPFVPSQSLVNIRDLGKVKDSSVPAGRFYRCGTLEFAKNDPQAAQWMSANVKKIFDLRNAEEVAAKPDPVFVGVENVQLQWPSRPLKSLEANSFVEDGGNHGWRTEYLKVMQLYAPVYREVLKHIRDQPAESILLHCTAGRDRTGAISGLIHHLAGSPAETISRDYMLSRIGTEVAREQLLGYALKTIGSQSRDPNDWPAGFENLVSLRPGFWTAFEQGMQEEYGGWDGYVIRELGFSEEDLERIKKNLRS